jgi:hypothetical protein
MAGQAGEKAVRSMRRLLMLTGVCIASACANAQELAEPALQSAAPPLAARFQAICSSEAALDRHGLVANAMRVRWVNAYNPAFRPTESAWEESFAVTERSAIGELGIGDVMLAWREGGTAYADWLFVPDGIELENAAALAEFSTPPDPFDLYAGFGDVQVYRFRPVPEGGNCPASEAILDTVTFYLQFQRDWDGMAIRERRPLLGRVYPAEMRHALWPYAQMAGSRDYSQLIELHDQLRVRVAAGECLLINRIPVGDMPYQPSHTLSQEASADGVMTEHRFEISGQGQFLFEERRVSWRPAGGELQRCCVSPFRNDRYAPRQCRVPNPDDPFPAAVMDLLETPSE